MIVVINSGVTYEAHKCVFCHLSVSDWTHLWKDVWLKRIFVPSSSTEVFQLDCLIKPLLRLKLGNLQTYSPNSENKRFLIMCEKNNAGESHVSIK